MSLQEIFHITLADNCLFYVPGQTLKGTVMLNISRPLDAYRIALELYGEAHVNLRHRNTGPQYGQHHHKHHHHRPGSNTSILLKAFVTVWGGQGNDTQRNMLILPSGQHQFPFAFVLPTRERLPTSLELEYGYIRYCIHAWIDCSQKSNYKTFKYFQLIFPLNCHLPQFMRPIQTSNASAVCVKFCKMAYFEGSLQMERKAYCPGELCYITMNVTNHYRKPIQSVKIEFEKIIEYRTYYNALNTVERVLSQTIDTEIPAMVSNFQQRVAFDIPITTPDINNCSKIKLSHRVRIKLKRRSTLLSLLVPIVVCTVLFQPEATIEASNEPVLAQASHSVKTCARCGFQAENDDGLCPSCGSNLKALSNSLPRYSVVLKEPPPYTPLRPKTTINYYPIYSPLILPSRPRSDFSVFGI